MTIYKRSLRVGFGAGRLVSFDGFVLAEEYVVLVSV
jgi:hypothetical protein